MGHDLLIVIKKNRHHKLHHFFLAPSRPVIINITTPSPDGAERASFTVKWKVGDIKQNLVYNILVGKLDDCFGNPVTLLH